MLSKIKAAVEWLRNLRVRVAEAVLSVERELGGRTGAEKRKAVTEKLDGMVKLPWALDSVIDADGKIIGYIVDRVCDVLNILTDGNFAGLTVDPEKLAAVADAPVDAVMSVKSAVPAQQSKQQTVDDRLAKLYKLYGIEAEAEADARAEALEEPEPAAVSAPAIAAPKTSDDEKWDRCIKVVGVAEGGANFDVVGGRPVLKEKNKSDKGGLTKYGVTQGTLAKAYADGVVGHADIVNLTKAEAERIYRSMYCDPYGWLDLPFAACLCLLDATINHGMGGTAAIAQRTCNFMAWSPKLAADGKWGPNTREAVWALAYNDSAWLASTFLRYRKDYYDGIIKGTPSQEAFRAGWYNRLKMLAKACNVVSPV
jgi:hypothetical protein